MAGCLYVCTHAKVVYPFFLLWKCVYYIVMISYFSTVLTTAWCNLSLT
jgi:hypothetical protein